MQSENDYTLTTRLLSVPKDKTLVIEISNYCDLTNIIIDKDDYRIVEEILKHAILLVHNYDFTEKLYYNTARNSISSIPNIKDTIIVPFEHLIHHVYDLL